jgi:hypothetical protein
MGDEELKFTEEEARCWADDPRNQARAEETLLRPLAVCVLLAITFLFFIWLANSPAVQHPMAVEAISEAPRVP